MTITREVIDARVLVVEHAVLTSIFVCCVELCDCKIVLHLESVYCKYFLLILFSYEQNI